MNYYKEKMKELNADGIDFMPTSFLENVVEEIIASYTKEQFIDVNCIPKTNYKYWKIQDGKKVYLD